MPRTAINRAKIRTILCLFPRHGCSFPASISRPPILSSNLLTLSQIAGARWCSIKHRRDLLDVDAFLGRAQFVVGDRDDDRGEARPDCSPDRGADKCQGLASCGRQSQLKEWVDQAQEEQQEHDPEDLPAMALGQFPA